MAQKVVKCCTWNVGGKSTSTDKLNFLNSTFDKAEVKAEILVLCFQEIVSLKSTRHQLEAASSRLSCRQALNKEAMEWVNCTESFLGRLTFSTNDKYHLVHKCQMFGMLMLIFCAESLSQEELLIPSARKVATGWHRVCGNKGGIICDFPLKLGSDVLRLVFVGVHLPPKERNVKTRRKVIKKVLKAVPKGPNIAIFALGDFNFRVTRDLRVKDKEMIKELNKKKTNTEILLRKDLEQRDQFNQELQGSLYGFHEPVKDFLPTYKFMKHKDSYKSSVRSKINPLRIKTKIPSWTDRIIISAPTDERYGCEIEDVFYSSLNDVTSSDHKPVIGVFTVKTTKL